VRIITSEVQRSLLDHFHVEFRGQLRFGMEDPGEARNSIF
jgi:hypothetical protein